MSATNKFVFRTVRVTFSLLVTVLILFGLFKTGEWGYEFGYRVFTESAVDSEPGTDKIVTVSSDMSEKQIGDLLEEKGLIRDAKLFVAQLKLSAYADSIKSGTYTLNTSMTAREMMQVMSAEELEDTESET